MRNDNSNNKYNAFEDQIVQVDLLNTVLGGSLMPRINFREEEHFLVLEIGLPSISPEQINIRLQDSTLHVVVLMPEEASRRDEKGIHTVPLFHRAFPVPPFVDASSIESVYKRETSTLWLRARKNDSEDSDATDLGFDIQ